MFYLNSKQLFIYLGLLMITSSLSAQKLWVINDQALREMQYLLDKWKYNIYQDDRGIQREQQIQISEKSQALFISERVYIAGDTTDKWENVYRIPLMAIDSITMNYMDTILLFHTNGDRVRKYMNGIFFSGKSKTIGLRARLPEVRNLSGQLMAKLRYYQKENKNEIPQTARKLVVNAVYDYLLQRRYNSHDVEKLLSIKDLYVSKCQICEGTRQAFRNYASENKIQSDISYQMSDLRKRLFSGNFNEQFHCLEQLVSEAIEEYYENGMFNEEELNKMKAMLLAEREKSMAFAKDGKCASCDGACKKE